MKNTPTSPAHTAPNPAQLQTAREVARLSRLPASITPTVERAIAQLLADRAIR
jgi:hypothetical protein